MECIKSGRVKAYITFYYIYFLFCIIFYIFYFIYFYLLRFAHLLNIYHIIECTRHTNTPHTNTRASQEQTQALIIHLFSCLDKTFFLISEMWFSIIRFTKLG